MVRRNQTMTLLGVLLAASVTLSRSAPAEKAEKGEKGGPPGNNPAATAAREHRAAPAAKDKDHHHPDKGLAGVTAAHAAEPHEGKRHAEHGEGKGPHGEGAAAAAADSDKREARREQRAEFKSAVADLRDRQAQGKLSKEELKKELAALDKSRNERRREHREALKQRWGADLARPPAREELRHHERRMAQLERMSLLAQSERSGAAKGKLVARIDKLVARENERHQRKMTQVAAQPGTTQPASAVDQTAPALPAPGDKAAADKGATP